MDLFQQLETTFDTKKVDICTFMESKDFVGKPLYPRQRLLLKLIFLEELNDYEEAVLDYWIKGGRHGDEITLSPYIRERTEILRAQGAKHFREIVWVGGRRSSKGHVTGGAMAYKMYNCYDDQTEVFTDQGWKLFRDLDGNEKFATRNQRGEVEYQAATETFAKEYQGDLWGYSSGVLDFLVTPHHRMLVDRAESKNRTTPSLRPLDELRGTFVSGRETHKWAIPKTSIVPDRESIWPLSTVARRQQFVASQKWSDAQIEWLRSHHADTSTPDLAIELGRSVESVRKMAYRLGLSSPRIRVADRPAPLPIGSLDDFAAFVGFWLAEGTKIKHGRGGYSVIVSQTKPEGVAWIESLLERLGWPVTRRENGSGYQWYISSYELREYLHGLQLPRHELRLPTEALTHWPHSALKSLLEGLLMGDGNFCARQGRFTAFHNSSKNLCDEVQALLAHVGMTGNVTKTSAPGRVTSIDGRPVVQRRSMYRVAIKDDTHSKLDLNDIQVVPYHGFVYCVTVPNSTLFVRRNDKSMWCGNTLRLDDPNAVLGVDADKEIYFSCIATSQDQAKKFQYADFSGMVNSCKAMHKYIHKTQELEFSVKTPADMRRIEEQRARGMKVMRDTSKLRGVALPANAASIRGSTTLVTDFDEFAFFQQGESAQSDSECYNALKPSLDQFGAEAMVFVKSSPYSKVGMFYERFEVAMETDNGGPAAANVFGIRLPSWALYEGWWEVDDYKGMKQCQMASPDWVVEKQNPDGSYFYSPKDRELIRQAQQEERENPEKFKVERRAHWSETIDAYLLPDKVEQMFAGKPLPDGTGYEPLHVNWNASSYAYRYFAHLDPSSTTAGFGFGLAHIEYMGEEGKEIPHVVFDIIKRWNAVDYGGVIVLDRVLEEIMGYIDIFRPAEVTTDQFSSGAIVQGLRRMCQQRNLTETRIYEVVATSSVNWNRYETFKTALYRGLVHAPCDTDDTKYCSQELKYLQVINTGQIPRVEKQTVGPVQTKDMADVCARLVEALIGNLMANMNRDHLNADLRMGSQGGYPMLFDQGMHPMGRATLNMAHNMERANAKSRNSRPRRDAAPSRTWGAKSNNRPWNR